MRDFDSAYKKLGPLQKTIIHAMHGCLCLCGIIVKLIDKFTGYKEKPYPPYSS